MTQRQAIAIKLMSENVRISVAKAMKYAGYSASSCRKPRRLTQSKAYLDFMDARFPLERLFRVHREALEATKWEKHIKQFVPDHNVRLNAVHTAFELRGILPNRWTKKVEPQITFSPNLD